MNSKTHSTFDSDSSVLDVTMSHCDDCKTLIVNVKNDLTSIPRFFDEVHLYEVSVNISKKKMII